MAENLWQKREQILHMLPKKHCWEWHINVDPCTCVINLSWQCSLYQQYKKIYVKFFNWNGRCWSIENGSYKFVVCNKDPFEHVIEVRKSNSFKCLLSFMHHCLISLHSFDWWTKFSLQSLFGDFCLMFLSSL